MIELNDLDVELDNLDRWDWMHGDRDIKIYVSTYLSIGRLGTRITSFLVLLKLRFEVYLKKATIDWFIFSLVEH